MKRSENLYEMDLFGKRPLTFKNWIAFDCVLPIIMSISHLQTTCGD